MFRHNLPVAFVASLLGALGVTAHAGSQVILERGLGMPSSPPPTVLGSTIVYDSIPSPFPGSFPSLGYEATSADEAGDHVTLGGTSRLLQTVEISLTDWACENDYTFDGNSWVPNRASDEACQTTPGSGYNHPITLNIYAVDNTGPDPAPGALLATKTASFFIPFRPSWDSVNCAAQSPAADVPFGGTWFDPVLNACVHGYSTTLTFDLTADNLTLPDEIIYSVAFNTANHGAAPLGAVGPYSSLNLSLTTDPAFVGTNVEPDAFFWDSSFAGFYCDGGAGGLDTFRRDDGPNPNDCWFGYTPVARFNTNAPQVPASNRGILIALVGLLALGLALRSYLVRH